MACVCAWVRVWRERFRSRLCGLAFGDSVPSGLGDRLPLHSRRGGCLAKRMEFLNCFALGRGKRGKRIFLVGVACDSGRLGDDFLTHNLNRKVESVGVSVWPCSHCFGNAGKGGGTFDRESNLAGGCGLRGVGCGVGHGKNIANALRMSMQSAFFFVFFRIFFSKIFRNFVDSLQPSPISRKNVDGKSQGAGGGHFFQSPLKIAILVFSLTSKKIRLLIQINLIKYLV